MFFKIGFLVFLGFYKFDKYKKIWVRLFFDIFFSFDSLYVIVYMLYC